MSETPDETQQEQETQEQDGPEPDETLAPVAPDAEDEEAEAEEERLAEPEELPEGAESVEGAGGPRELSQKEIEARLDKLNREGERHAARVQAIMEEHMADLTPCELCWTFAPGFRFDPIPDEQRAHVMVTLGLSEARNYAQDKHADACGDCLGWGLVATGSKVKGQEALPCKNCGGRGWMGDRALTPVAAPPLSPMREPDNGAPEVVPQSPEVLDVMAAAKAAGLIVIDPHASTPS